MLKKPMFWVIAALIVIILAFIMIRKHEDNSNTPAATPATQVSAQNEASAANTEAAPSEQTAQNEASAPAEAAPAPEATEAPAVTAEQQSAPAESTQTTA